MLNMSDIVNDVNVLLTRVKSVKFNQARCQTLANRVEACKTAIGLKRDDVNYVKALTRFKECLQVCSKLIEEHTVKYNTLDRFVRFINEDNINNRFQVVNEQLKALQKDFNLMVVTATFINIEQDRKDAAADREKITWLLDFVSSIDNKVDEIKTTVTMSGRKLNDVFDAQIAGQEHVDNRFGSARDRQQETVALLRKLTSSSSTNTAPLEMLIREKDAEIATLRQQVANLQASLQATPAKKSVDIVENKAEIANRAETYYQKGLRHDQKREYGEAHHCYQQAIAANRHLKALNSLGSLLSNGLGCQKDAKAAHSLYKEAAGRGYDRAMLSLATQFEKGAGVEKNLDTANEWYHKAEMSFKSRMPADARSLQLATEGILRTAKVQPSEGISWEDSRIGMSEPPVIPTTPVGGVFVGPASTIIHPSSVTTTADTRRVITTPI